MIAHACMRAAVVHTCKHAVRHGSLRGSPCDRPLARRWLLQGAKGAKAFEKAEDPIFALENGLPIDFQHYLEHHLSQPLKRIFEPVLKNPDELLTGAWGRWFGGGGEGQLRSLLRLAWSMVKVAYPMCGTCYAGQCSQRVHTDTSAAGCLVSHTVTGQALRQQAVTR